MTADELAAAALGESPPIHDELTDLLSEQVDHWREVCRVLLDVLPEGDKARNQ